MTDSAPRRWASLREMAAYYGISLSQARVLRKEGVLPSYQLLGKVMFDLLECDTVIHLTRRGQSVPEDLPRVPMGPAGGSLHGHGSGFSAPLGGSHPAAVDREVAATG